MVIIMKLIDCRLMEIKSFSIERGFQPTDAIFYILEGSFSLEAEGQKHIIKKGDFTSFPADMEFERHMITPLKLYNIRYEQDGTVPRGKVKIKDHNRLLSTLSYMTKLSLDPDGDQKLKDYYLGDIFMQIKTEELLESLSFDSVVNDTVAFLEHNLEKKLSISEIARSVGVSVSGLIGHFRKSIGITPMRYLSLLRIKKAETLLVTSTYPLSQIAAECGFDNAFYFSNAFKKEKGLAPTAYRKKYGI